MKFKIEIMDTGPSTTDENLLFIDLNHPQKLSKIDTVKSNFAMSLSKCIIEKMGGKINVDTQNDVGNRFTVEMIAISRVGPDKRVQFGVKD